MQEVWFSLFAGIYIPVTLSCKFKHSWRIRKNHITECKIIGKLNDTRESLLVTIELV